MDAPIELFSDIVMYGEGDVMVAHGFQPDMVPEGIRNAEYACLVHCTKGSATLSFADRTLTLAAKDLIIVPPFVTVELVRRSRSFDVSVLATSRRFVHRDYYHKSLSMSDFIKFFHARPVLHMDDEEIRFFKGSLNLISQTISLAHNRFKEDVLHCQIASFSMWMNGLISHHLNLEPVNLRHSDQLFSRFLELVPQHFKQEHGLSFYANRLCVSTKYLSAISKKVSGQSASHWITQRLIAEAKSLLKTSHLSISQISTLLGFPNQSCFGKYFKKETGFSPSDYRFEN